MADYYETPAADDKQRLERWRKRCNRCHLVYVDRSCPNCHCPEFTVMEVPDEESPVLDA